MKRLLMLMLLIQASGVKADVYTWTDARGTAHYTNKEYEIPQRYRAKAKPMHIESVESVGAHQQGAPTQPQGTPSTPTAAAPSPPSPAPPPVARAPVSPASAGNAAPQGRRKVQSGK